MQLDGRETEELLRRAREGDESSVGQLLERHRGRLRRMVAERLDRRVAARVDASDVVQEAMSEASRRLPAFLRGRPVPYYTWLRRLTLLHLAWSHRFHLGSRKRSAALDVELEAIARAGASTALLDRLPATDTSPIQHAIREEECRRVRAVLECLEPPEREFLELLYVERVSLAEIATRLGLGTSAAKMRHLRALKRFRRLLVGGRAKPTR